MSAISTQAPRRIIEDFAREIQQRKQTTAHPAREVINFRGELQANKERDIVHVPVELLRFRKDNGRISSDVLNYECNVGPLKEEDQRTQEILAGFLQEKDKEKTEDLRKSILHDGQRDPAIITCDGFLINGNRRKLALQLLKQEHPGDRFAFMKVVILPGPDEEG